MDMEGNLPKRVPEEVLFKWDDGTDSKRHHAGSLSAGVSAVSSFLAEPLSTRAANAFKNVASSRVVPSDRVDTNNVHVEAQKIRETVANIQLSHNRDWLSSNTHVTALAKLDVLDRLSCLLLNRESAMRYESLRYSQRECTSEFEFHRVLYEARLSRLNSALVPEFCVQPIYIRNSTLVSKLKENCGCPLHVYVEWNIRQSQPAGPRGPAAGTGVDISFGTFRRASTNVSYLQPYGSGEFFTAREDPLSSPYVPNAEGTRSDSFHSFSDSAPPMGLSFADNSGSNVQYPNPGSSGPGDVLPAATTNHSSVAEDSCDDWKLRPGHFQRQSQVKGPVTTPSANAKSSHNGISAFEHVEAICPMHSAVGLPDLLCERGGHMHVISELGLLCRYDQSPINGESVHVMSLHKLRGGQKVSHFRLPSRLQAVKAVHLRDFELERYASAFDLDENNADAASKLGREYLASLYSGPALLIVTSSEFIIAMVHESSGDFRLGVLFRERNIGHDIRDVICHRASGRVFMLAANSLLYEFQYQLGAVDVKDHSIFGKLLSTAAKGCKILLNALSSDRVYKLYGTVPSGYTVEADTNEEGTAVDGTPNWWESSGNCLQDSSGSCPALGTAYWPPSEWRALHLSLQESSFSDGSNKESCTCVSRSCCVKRECRTCLKLLNPWNKSYFGVLSVGDSHICLDQDRWLLCMLSHDTGDLSVFKIADECNYETFVKGVVEFGRLFPYNLTFFCLRQGDLVTQLTRAGYFRLVGSPSGFRCVTVLNAPLGGTEGVDIILVDNFGTRIFIGFVTDSQNKTSLVVKGFKVAQTFLNRRSLAIKSSYHQMGMFWRDRYAGSPGGTRPARPKYYYLNDLFVSCETYGKSGNLSLAKVSLFTPESASLCHSNGDAPQSVSEELWSHNQRVSSGGNISSGASASPSSNGTRPVEWFDEFCFLTSPDEEILEVYAERRPCVVGETPCGLGWELIFVTSQKMYTFHRSSLLHVISALLQHPLSTLRYLDPPPLWREHRPSHSIRRESPVEGKEGTHFVDIFADASQRGDMLGEDTNKGLVAYGLYYLCWLYTPEEVFKVCWQFLLDHNDPVLEAFLLQTRDEHCLLLSSMGIPSRLFGWTAPGAYAIDDLGNPTTPVVSPWCKFVIFEEPRCHRFNRIRTCLTSSAVDGALSLVCSMLESLWLERTFSCTPLFTSASYSPPEDSAVPFTPNDQLPRRNEFVVGPRFASNIILCLSRPVEDVKSLLAQMRKLYLLLNRVTVNYESLQNSTMEWLAHSVGRLLPRLQRDIFSEKCSEDISSCPGVWEYNFATGNGPVDVGGSSFSCDFATLLRRIRDRHTRDVKTLRELVTLLEISQEYLACCVLLHRNCILGDAQHEFGQMFTNVELLPSQSCGRLSLNDLRYHRVIRSHEPTVSAFSVQLGTAWEATPYAFTMSREFFYIIWRSNLLNL
ncbi:uncharacterized protein BXIN_0997 [Babesia sp. Xinjiang]|uniref:uncharacterized protein n=1 Tax=Babesia sp. Xinjiang TaxID=462227 RepID=UPI000A25CEB6|nr:uncharacterized protein BXIN_0997 [Babesia sp. Xinjiang]ORM42210.1 hypothetical protein BXIN_0997 [Babesia sp. Xinjiang]